MAVALAAIPAGVAQAASSDSLWTPRELIVAFDDSVSDAAARTVVASAGGEVRQAGQLLRLIEACRDHVETPRMYRAVFSSEQAASDGMTKLQADASVEWVQRNNRAGLPNDRSLDTTGAVSGTSEAPAVNDPRYPEQWGLHNNGQVIMAGYPEQPYPGKPDADIDWPEALATGADGGGQIIAVVDTGVTLDHPALAARIWTNTGETPGNGQDDDGNGWVDDIHGYDTGVGDPDPYSTAYHGTAVAGVAAAAANDAIGTAGVAPDARIMAIRMIATDFVTDINALNVAESFAYAIKNGADVMNNSWGWWAPGAFGDPLVVLAEACANAAGMLVVWSGGNAGPLFDNWPNYYPVENVIRAGYFNWVGGDPAQNPTVDILAPGEKVLAPYYGSAANPEGYGLVGGSSFAAPHVAGTAALVRSLYPQLTPAEVKRAIKAGATPAPPLTPGSWPYGSYNPTIGRLNAAGAIAAARPPDPSGSGGGTVRSPSLQTAE
ncbi:MAG TPA: S8 family serine peptidase [Thermoleophilaceae bacterium]|nr:S8 family serine peptidase [Thermoleophilaceae bacterium]